MKWFAGASLVLLSLVLAGCAYRGDYRLDDKIIYQPTSHVSNGMLKVDVSLGRPFDGRCVLKNFSAGEASGRFRHSFPDGSPTLRLIFPTKVKDELAAQGDLEGGIRDVVMAILKQAKEERCLEFSSIAAGGNDDAINTDLSELAGFVARRARARWPMTTQEAVATWFGPGAVRFIVGDEGKRPRPQGEEIISRVTFLRSGMRVCAQDVVDPSPTAIENLYTIAGTACATVIDGPNGMAFSGTTPWLDLPFTGSPWAAGGFKQVTSWEEIQTGEGPHQFVVVHPTKLPEKPPNPDASNGAFLVRFDPSEQIKMQSALCIKSGLATNECSAHAAFQAVGPSFRAEILCASQSNNVCVRFGKRSVFTVDIPVIVNGSRLYLPAGSTFAGVVGEIAADFFGSPVPNVRAAAYRGAGHRGRLQRLLGKVQLQRWFDGKRYKVQIGEDALDLPLQPGDEIRW